MLLHRTCNKYVAMVNCLKRYKHLKSVFFATSCSLADGYQHFIRTCCLHLQDQKVTQASHKQRQNVDLYQTAQSYIPDDSKLHSRNCENFKSNVDNFVFHIGYQASFWCWDSYIEEVTTDWTCSFIREDKAK